MHEKAGDLLILGSRIAFLALVVFAAANFGLTRESGIAAFNAGAGGIFVLWLIGCALAGRRPAVGGIPLTLSLAILAFGWLSAGTALLEIRLADQDVPDWLNNLFLYFAAYHADLAWAAMLRTTALLAAFVMALDLFASPTWGRALLTTLGLTGLSMVAFVFLQKMTGSLLILHAQDGGIALSFGVYRYWGNAASFLNLTWPIVAAIAVHTGIRKARGWSLWMTAAIATFAGLYINVSKAGHVLGVIGLIFFSVLAFVYVSRIKQLSRTTIPWPTLATIAVAAGLLAGALFYGINWNRWDEIKTAGWNENPRPIAYEHFAKIIPDAGWTGFGPGNFQRIYGKYIKDAPIVQATPFWVAHEDYIQTLVEWGWAGTTLWGILFLPAAIRLATRSLGKRENRRSSHDRDRDYEFDWRDKLLTAAKALPAPSNPLVQAAGLTSIVLTALHATVDFPMQIESTQFYFLLWIALGWQPGDGKSARRPVPTGDDDNFSD